jgi:integrase
VLAPLPRELMEAREVEIWPQLMALLEGSSNEVARVLKGELNQETTAEQSEELYKEIITAKRTQRDAYPYLKCLVKWKEWLNSTQGTSLCISRIPIYTKPPVSPFVEDVRAYPSRYKYYLDRLFSSVGSELSAKGEIGQLLFSAILLGGLHHRHQLHALQRVLHEPLKWLGGKVWIVLTMKSRKQEELERRIWEPDPLTEMMLLNLSEEARGYLNKHWENFKQKYQTQDLIKQFQQEIGVTLKDMGNYTELFKIANYMVSLRSPILAGHYQREFMSHGLKPHVWERLLGMPVTSIEEEKFTESTRPADVSEMKTLEMESHWYHNLRKKVIVDASEDELRTLLEAYEREGYGHGACLMVEWTIDTLASKKAPKRNTTINRARNNLTVAGKWLVSLTEGRDITLLDSDDLNELYELAIESAISSNQRRSMKKGLKHFHNFMMKAYGKGPIIDDEIFHNTGILPVDSTIICEDEYQQIRKRIAIEPDLNTTSRKVAELSAIVLSIAFRTGTRRREVLYLSTNDLIPSNRTDPFNSVEVDLLVRPNFARKLKTTASQRRLPLHALMERDELEALLGWWARRREEEAQAKYSAYLFAIRDIGWERVDHDQFIPKLHKVMRSEVGDPSLRFHHMRHSAASWISLRLMVADLDNYEPIFINRPLTEAMLAKSGEFRERLYRNNLITRRHIYATASILGHSSPVVTLEHYIHLLAQIAPFVRYKIDNGILASASRIPSVTIYRSEAHKNPKRLLEMVRKRAVKRGVLIDLSAVAEKAEAKRRPGRDAALQLKRLWMAMLLCSKSEETTLGDIARVNEYELEYFTNVVDRARYLSQLPASRLNTLSVDTFRHNQNNRDRESDEEISFSIPEWPRQLFARDLIENYALNVVTLANEPLQVLEGGHTVADVVDYVMENYWRSKYDMVFKDPSQESYARGYRDLLRRIGVRKSEIEHRIFMSRADWHRNKEHWAHNMLEEGGYRVKHVGKTWDNYEKLNEALSIKAVYNQFEKVSEEKEDINNLYSASYGLYMLLYMMECMVAGSGW